MGSVFKGEPRRPFAFEPDGQTCGRFITASCCTQTPGTYLILQETKCVVGASFATGVCHGLKILIIYSLKYSRWRQLRIGFGFGFFLRHFIVTGR